MMKIIFLDIDGVLNSLRSVIGIGQPSKHFDPVAVGLLDSLVSETDAHVVVSSSWRHGDTSALIKELEGLSPDATYYESIVDETPGGYNGVRGEQIKAWLDRQIREIEAYCIIDDDSDILEEQKPFFVHTTFNDGFLMEHYWEAIRILDPENLERTRFLGGRK